MLPNFPLCNPALASIPLVFQRAHSDASHRDFGPQPRAHDAHVSTAFRSPHSVILGWSLPMYRILELG